MKLSPGLDSNALGVHSLVGLQEGLKSVWNMATHLTLHLVLKAVRSPMKRKAGRVAKYNLLVLERVCKSCTAFTSQHSLDYHVSYHQYFLKTPKTGVERTIPTFLSELQKDHANISIRSPTYILYLAVLSSINNIDES